MPTANIYTLLLWSGFIHLDGRDMVYSDASPTNAAGQSLYQWATSNGVLCADLCAEDMDSALEAFRTDGSECPCDECHFMAEQAAEQDRYLAHQEDRDNMQYD